MGYPRRLTVDLTTSTGGAATGYVTPVQGTDDTLHGAISTVQYTPATATGDRFATTADITITGEVSGQQILKLTNVTATSAVFYAPTQITHTATGGARLYAASGTNVGSLFTVADERIKVVVAQGGVTKTGTVAVIVS